MTASPLSTASNVFVVPAGEGLALELQDPLNTRTTRKGDRVNLTTATEVLVDGRVAIPQGSTVRATVTESKRPGRLFGKAQIQLEFDEIALPDGTALPLSANLSRAGWWDHSGKIKQTAQGERGRGHDVYVIGQGAAQGAIMGTIFSGRKGAVRGAAIGAAISTIGILIERGPDLDLPPGMMFEIELTKALSIPAPAAKGPELATEYPPFSSPASLASSELATDKVVPSTAEVKSSPEVSPPPTPDSRPTDNVTSAANRTPPSPAASPPPLPVDPSLPEGNPGGFKLKVDVNLVLVEATVRDDSGRILEGLKREDFRLFEDGAEQEIQHFSRDELPLAVALVVDRSGSVAPVLSELQRAAYDTLSLLKPDDQVALFAFASRPERLENLTTDRDRIAERIAAIDAGGGTNITDALFDATLYLGRAAHTRRHALILVSDNQPTVRGYAGGSDVVRLALETETVIYSNKIGDERSTGIFNLPLSIPGAGSVKKITRETGGEIIDARRVGSLHSAMATVISRLKQRYTLGYQSTNKRRDGAFRTIEVRLAARLVNSGSKYRVYARRGYYAPVEHVAARQRTP